MENKNRYAIMIYEDGKCLVKGKCNSVVLGYSNASSDDIITVFGGCQNDCLCASALLDARIKRALLDEE